MRLFVAVELDQEVVERLARLVRELREALPDIRWARRESLHLTLRFLGEVDESRVDELSAVLEEAAGSVGGAIRLEVEGLGTFGDRKRPRVVWAGVRERTGALEALVEAVERAVVSRGFERESKPFRPHLTLARLKRSSPGLGRALAARAGTDLGVSTISEITLMRSRLRPEGAEYKALRKFSLGAADRRGSGEGDPGGTP